MRRQRSGVTVFAGGVFRIITRGMVAPEETLKLYGQRPRSLRKCPEVGSGVRVHQNGELAAGGAEAPGDTPDRSACLVIAFQNPGDRHVRMLGGIFLTVAQR